jgi:transposase
MPAPLHISVKESVSELKKLQQGATLTTLNKILMLLLIKASPHPIGKYSLSDQVGVDPNSIQSWRKKYVKGGLHALLNDGRVGFKPTLLNAKQHNKIALRLQSPHDAFTSFRELQKWVDSFSEGINYNSLRHYVKRHFGAKLKIGRKSHIQKDEKAVSTFKKSSGSTA